MFFTDAWRERWTKGWGYVTVGAGTAFSAIQGLALIVNNSDVKTAITGLGLNPKLTLGIAIFGAITLLSMEHKD